MALPLLLSPSPSPYGPDFFAGDYQLDATVHLTAGGRFIRGDRARLAESDGGQVVHRDPVLREVIANGGGARLFQPGSLGGRFLFQAIGFGLSGGAGHFGFTTGTLGFGGGLLGQRGGGLRLHLRLFRGGATLRFGVGLGLGGGFAIGG